MLLCKYCNAPGACAEYCGGANYQGPEDFDETEETETDETEKGETEDGNEE